MVDHEAFELVEDWSVGDVLLAAVALGDVDHTDGGSTEAFHLADLTVAGVGGEDHLTFFGVSQSVHEKCFPFVAGGVASGHVEGTKDVPVPIDFGVPKAGKANGVKNSSDFVDGLGNGVEVACWEGVAGGGNVDPVRS